MLVTFMFPLCVSVLCYLCSAPCVCGVWLPATWSSDSGCIEGLNCLEPETIRQVSPSASSLHPPSSLAPSTNRTKQTHTDTHRHTQTHTDTHRQFNSSQTGFPWDFNNYMDWMYWTELPGLDYMDWTTWTGLHGLDFRDWTTWTGLHGLDYMDWTSGTGLHGLDYMDWTTWTGLQGLDYMDWISGTGLHGLDLLDWTSGTGLHGLDFRDWTYWTGLNLPIKSLKLRKIKIDVHLFFFLHFIELTLLSKVTQNDEEQTQNNKN